MKHWLNDVRWLGALIAAIVLAAGTAARALPELAPVQSPTAAIVFTPVTDLEQHPNGEIEPQARHATPADSADWQASLYTSFTGADGEIYPCTAALVGPGALLTAAHCVPSDPAIKVEMDRLPVEPHGDRHTLTCTRSDTYAKDASTDWALCAINPAIAAPKTFKFERIQIVPLGNYMQATHLSLLLGGYGCTSDYVADTDPPPGQKFGYNIGRNAVVATSTSPLPHASESRYYAPKQNANLFTDPWNGTNLCPGDSGGPAFSITGAFARPYAQRVIVAINITAFWTSPSHVEWGGSALSSLGVKDFKRWAQTWAGTAHVVCGIVPDTPPDYCR